MEELLNMEQHHADDLEYFASFEYIRKQLGDTESLLHLQ